MKRGTLNFLGRKNQSLFDTKIRPKDLGESGEPSTNTFLTADFFIYTPDLLRPTRPLYQLVEGQAVKAAPFILVNNVTRQYFNSVSKMKTLNRTGF